MKKKNVLKRNIDFDRIIKNNNLERTDNEEYHFGLSVGKKVGNAVIRNRVKRQLRSIIDEKNYQKGLNCIIIVKKGILDKSFNDMKVELFEAFNKLHIIKEI